MNKSHKLFNLKCVPVTKTTLYTPFCKGKGEWKNQRKPLHWVRLALLPTALKNNPIGRSTSSEMSFVLTVDVSRASPNNHEAVRISTNWFIAMLFVKTRGYGQLLQIYNRPGNQQEILAWFISYKHDCNIHLCQFQLIYFYIFMLTVYEMKTCKRGSVSLSVCIFHPRIYSTGFYSVSP